MIGVCFLMDHEHICEEPVSAENGNAANGVAATEAADWGDGQWVAPGENDWGLLFDGS